MDVLPELVPSLAHAWRDAQLWDAIGPVAKVYESLRAKISPESWPKTLLGLNLLALEAPAPPKRAAKAEEELLVASLRYLRLANAAYGRVTLRPAAPGAREAVGAELRGAAVPPCGAAGGGN